MIGSRKFTIVHSNINNKKKCEEKNGKNNVLM